MKKTKSRFDYNTQMNIHVFLDDSLWIIALLMGILTLICYIKVYFFNLELAFFQDFSYFYYLCVFIYAYERKVRYQLFPQETPRRYSEFILIGWLAFTFVIGAVTLFLFKERRTVFFELVILDSVLAGILGFGQVIKKINVSFFNLKVLDKPNGTEE